MKWLCVSKSAWLSRQQASPQWRPKALLAAGIAARYDWSIMPLPVDPSSAAVSKQIAESINQVLDSPLKEIGNYIADKIRYLRYGSLLKIVEKADQKAKAKNLNIKMPPIKFFIPFCEAASLEDLETEKDEKVKLSDLWANLLISSSTEYDSRHIMFLRIIKEITVNEARFFDLLINKSRATKLRSLSWYFYEEAPYLNKWLVSNMIEDIGQTDPITLLEELFLSLECPGVRILDLAATLSSSDEDEEDASVVLGKHTVDRNETDIAMSALEGLNIGKMLSIDDVPTSLDPEVLVSITVFKLTDLGVAFLEACGFTAEAKEFDETISAGGPDA